MAQNGNSIIISLNGKAIAGTKVDEVQTICEAMEISGPTTGAWREYAAGAKGWVVSTNYLLGTADGISDLLRVGEVYSLSVGTRNGTKLRGTAILTSCVVTAQKGNLLQGSFSFQGTAELKKV